MIVVGSHFEEIKFRIRFCVHTYTQTDEIIWTLLVLPFVLLFQVEMWSIRGFVAPFESHKRTYDNKRLTIVLRASAAILYNVFWEH